MSILRRKGMTKAGFMLLRRPIVQMASSLISNTSSFSATNSACKFSACARWASKRSSRDASTQYRMSGSAGGQRQKKSAFWLSYHSHNLYHPGSQQLLTGMYSHVTNATFLTNFANANSCETALLENMMHHYQFKNNNNTIIPIYSFMCYLGQWCQQLVACWAHPQQPAQQSGWRHGRWSGGWRG